METHKPLYKNGKPQKKTFTRYEGLDYDLLNQMIEDQGQYVTGTGKANVSILVHDLLIRYMANQKRQMKINTKQD